LIHAVIVLYFSPTLFRFYNFYKDNTMTLVSHLESEKKNIIIMFRNDLNKIIIII